MLRYYKIKSFLTVFFAVFFAVSDVCAQDIFKIDTGKTAGKFSDWVQKQQENYQTVMEQISESQFATFIGDGIKSAKEGIQYAKDKYSEIVDTYNDIKGSVLDSDAYNIALKSKEIAEETKVLQDLQKQKEAKIAEIEEAAEIERTALEEKLNQAKSNLDIKSSVYQEELAKASDEDKAEIEANIELFKTESEKEIASIQTEIDDVDNNLSAEIEAVEQEFEEDIYTQGENIAELTKELEDMTQKEETSATSDPKQGIEEMMNDLSVKQGESVSLKDKKERSKRRASKSKKTALNASSEAVGVIAATEDTKDEQENISATSETVNGKSETVQFAITDIVNQMETLQQYLTMELMSIEAETTKIIVNSQIPTDEAQTSIDISNYTDDEEDDGKSIGELVNSAKDGISNIQDKIAEGEELIGEIGDAGKSLSEAGQSIGSMLGDSGTSSGSGSDVQYGTNSIDEDTAEKDNAAVVSEVAATSMESDNDLTSGSNIAYDNKALSASQGGAAEVVNKNVSSTLTAQTAVRKENKLSAAKEATTADAESAVSLNDLVQSAGGAKRKTTCHRQRSHDRGCRKRSVIKRFGSKCGVKRKTTCHRQRSHDRGCRKRSIIKRFSSKCGAKRYRSFLLPSSN